MDRWLTFQIEGEPELRIAGRLTTGQIRLSLADREKL